MSECPPVRIRTAFAMKNIDFKEVVSSTDRNLLSGRSAVQTSLRPMEAIGEIRSGLSADRGVRRCGHAGRVRVQALRASKTR
jgi:hypothetical protein